MANSKVQLADGTVIIDISDTTATEDDVLPGKTLYKSDGTKVTGSLGTATESSDGLMSSEDKAKLDGIEEHATENRIVKSVGRSSVASFQDGADNLPMALTVDIEPVQDLHGYDTPWPGGGGKNLIDKSLFNDGYHIDANGVPNIFPGRICTLEPIMVSGTSMVISYRNLVSSTSDLGVIYSVLNGETTKRRVAGKNQPVLTIDISDGDRVYIAMYKTIAGTNTAQDISFDDFDNLQLEYGNQKTAFAPYSNICPISGWTGCNITRNSANLIPDGTNTANGYEKDKYLKTDGTVGTSTTSNYISEYFPVEPNGIYTMRTEKKVQNNSCVCFYDENKNYIEGSAVNYQKMTKTISAPATAVWARATQTYDSSIDFAQFEKGSVPTEIVPYSCNEYQIDFPDGAGTVYGGTLTVNKDGTGTLVVNHVKHEMPTSGFSLLYTRDAVCIFSRQRNNVWDEKPVGLPNGTVISNLLKAIQTVNSSTDTPYAFSIYNTSNNYIRIALPPSVASTAEQLHTWLTNNPVEVVYEITEPVTYQLTALEVIETLKGINNIFADTGDILSVEYQTTAASDIVNVMEPQLISLLNAIFPVGTIYTTTSGIAPTFGEGWTWQEIVVPLTWNDLKTGERHAYPGNSSGGFHYWKRIA